MIPIIDRPIASNTPHSYTDPDAQLLATHALGTLIPFLTSKGNQISPLHRTALAELLLALARQAMGLTRGRLAYALPCGAGKTQSVVALVAAAHRMGLPLTFAISATQVLAIGRLKRDLIMAGIPASLIGMRHSKSRSEVRKLALEAGETELDEELHDTGDTDCPVMLICHARIRGSREFPAFCNYLGQKRDLLIWDESLMTTDADALSLLDAESSISRVVSSLPSQSELALVSREMDSRIGAEVARQKSGDVPTQFLLLPTVDTGEAFGAINAIRSSHSNLWRAAVETVKRLLRLAELPISLALTGHGGTGDGIIRYKVAVDPQLDNIAVLDASHTVRLLAQEPTIKNGTTNAMRECKRYSHVQVIEHRVPSGKHTLLGQREKGKAIAALVADYLRSIPVDEPVLIFTHKGDENRVLQKQMRSDLEGHGIDLGAETAGLKRINWLTWGNETSLNSFSLAYSLSCPLLGIHFFSSGSPRTDPLQGRAASNYAYKGSKCNSYEISSRLKPRASVSPSWLSR